MGKAGTIFSFVWGQRDAVRKGWRGTQAPGPQRPAQLSDVDSAAQQQWEGEPEASSQSQNPTFFFKDKTAKQQIPVS